VHRADHRDERERQQLAGVDQRRGRAAVDQRDVELPAQQGVNLRAGAPLGELGLHLRVVDGEPRQRRRDHGAAGDVVVADVHRAGPATGRRPGRLDGSVRVVEHPHGLGPERRPGRGQPDAVREVRSTSLRRRPPQQRVKVAAIDG
jgi:hypothetical protein